MHASATKQQIQYVAEYVTNCGFAVNFMEGDEYSMIHVLQDATPLRDLPIDSLPGVERLISVTCPFKLASREFKPIDTVAKSTSLTIGDSRIPLMGYVTGILDKDEYLLRMCSLLKSIGLSALILDWNDSSHEVSTQSKLMSLIRLNEEAKLPIIAKVMSSKQVDLVEPYIELLLVEANSIYNASLISKVGQLDKPVIIERGPNATIEEWLLVASSVIAEGNLNVILCEHGIRTFETRNILDVNAIPVIKQLSHLPILVDCSQAAVDEKSACRIARAAIAAGSDGLIFSLYDPSRVAQKKQAQLSVEGFKKLIPILRRLAEAVDRELVIEG